MYGFPKTYIDTTNANDSEEIVFESSLPGDDTEPIAGEVGILVLRTGEKIIDILLAYLDANNAIEKALEKASGFIQSSSNNSVQLILNIGDIMHGIEQRKFPDIYKNDSNKEVAERLHIFVDLNDDVIDMTNADVGLPQLRILESLLILNRLGYNIDGWGDDKIIKNILSRFVRTDSMQALITLKIFQQRKTTLLYSSKMQ